jgi:hypothetical protein
MRTGILAETGSPEDMLRVIRELRSRGYSELDAFSPYPVRGAEQALGLRRSPLTWIVFPISMAGAGLAILIEVFCNAIDYPINVGGRPLLSLPAFIPITFETGVLTASIAAILAYLGLAGLPQLYAPIFDVEGFEKVSIDRFWVGVDERDPMFDASEIERLFRGLGVLSVHRARQRVR